MSALWVMPVSGGSARNGYPVFRLWVYDRVRISLIEVRSLKVKGNLSLRSVKNPKG